MSDKLIVTSTNPDLTPDVIEEELLKAIQSKQIAIEKRKFREPYMKDRLEKVESAVGLVFQSMLKEIERVIKK